MDQVGKGETTTVTKIAIELPKDLADQAKAAGLLEQKAVEQLLRDALRRRAAAELLAATESVRQGQPPLSAAQVQSFVQEAIDAVRRSP